MGEKIVVGPINKGLRNDRTAFVIDNDSFPTLVNAYQWRGRIKRKRGTSLLGRLKRFFNSLSISYNSGATTTSLNIVGIGNILTGFGLEAFGNVVPGSVTITVGVNIYTDVNSLGDPPDGTLFDVADVPSGTIIYSFGQIQIPGEAGNNASAVFNYFPDLPVMGLEDLQLVSTQFPGTLAFDTTYSYNILTTFPYSIYDVSFYKNPPANATFLPGYTPKTDATPTTWNGNDYQQFWTVNYQGALWATNGIGIPFDASIVGMQFKPITNVTIIDTGPFPTVINPAKARLTIALHGLVVGDFIFVNEVLGTTGINFQTGYVVNVFDVNNVDVIFPFATLGGIYAGGGIAQYLTNRADITIDSLRFYDGDPTNGDPNTPVLTQGHGWVNFAPPLSQDVFSIADLPPAQYYLAGARIIIPFKDRLLFLGVVVENSGGQKFYLQDTVVYSQNGTPYYTASFTAGLNYPLPPVTVPTGYTSGYIEVLVPDNQTATPSAWFEDQTGFGGFISAGIAQPITTCSSNEDVLIVGFSFTKTRLVYTGNDLIPFLFYVINSELGDASTFSTINLDKGVISRGTRGFTITSQVESQRIDLEIPDEVFQINLTLNGNERFCAARDFINEWIYFTFPENDDAFKFPNQTLQYNYRDNTWAIFRESYTTYGAFRRQTGFTWQTVGLVYPTWDAWNDPWNAGTSTLDQQEVIAGNQQGFVIFRDDGTGEATSLQILQITGNTVISSPDHNLNEGDYIIISGALGTAGTAVNGKIFSVFNVSQNLFNLKPAVGAGTYFGGGLITRLYIPFVQTKQFPVAWGMSRKVRLGPQQYLLTTTDNGQITLLIFLSQNDSSPYNKGPIVPQLASLNNSLIYSTVLYTCPESTNLGLTPFNTNLQMPTAEQQEQIWHRINTSLIGDTVQIGFTLSDEQMRSLEQSGPAFPITAATNANPCVLDCTSRFQTGQLVRITGVLGMTELNNNIYQVIISSATTVTINVDSSTFGAYNGGGLVTPLGSNQFSEIELHGMILDVNPSQMLA